AASYQKSDSSNGAIFSVTGEGNKLSFPNLTTMKSTYYDADLSVSAEDGGEIDLSSLTSFEGSSYNYADNAITATSGGVVKLDSLSFAKYMTITAHAGETYNLPALTTYTNGTLTIADASAVVSVPNLVNIDDSVFTLSGGAQLTLNAASYQKSASSNGAVFTVTGAGTKLSLPNLTTMKASSSSADKGVSAEDGGEIDLSSLTEITVSGASYLSIIERVGGTITLDSLQTIKTEGNNRSLRFTTDKTTRSLPALVSVANMNFTSTPYTTVSFPALTTWTGGTLEILRESVVSMPSLATFSGTLTFEGNGFQPSSNLVLAAGGVLQGSGKIATNLTNAGTVKTDIGGIELEGDYSQTTTGTLSATITSEMERGDADYVSLAVSGNAWISGKVELVKPAGSAGKIGSRGFIVVEAENLSFDDATTCSGLEYSELFVLQKYATSTRLSFNIDYVSGARVVSVVPCGASSTNASRPFVDVYFDGVINRGSFTEDDIVVVNPAGMSIGIYSISALNAASTSFRVYLDRSSIVSGLYRVEIGPNILSEKGLVMNQNGAYPNGEADDKYVGTFELKLPDLSISNVTAPETAALGAKLNLSWTEVNTGTANALGSWRNQLYLARTPDGSGSRLPLATLDSGTGSTLGTAIAVDGSVTRSATVSIPLNESGWGPGDYYLVMESDVYGAVLELNETNNKAVSQKITLDYERTPDLVVSAITGPSNVAPGDQATLSWTTENVGELATAGSWNETIYMSFDGTTNDAIALTTLRRSGALAPGGSESRTTTVAIPSSTRVGAFRFLVVADPDNSLPETNEDNNVGLSAQASLAGKLFLAVAKSYVNEGDQSIRATVTRSGSVEQDATVVITVSDATELEAPASVVIPAGQTSAVFYFNALADNEFDGDQTATITATLDGYPAVESTIQITDKDVAVITLSADKTTLDEGDDVTLTVSLDHVVQEDTTVRLYVSRPNQLTFPGSVVVPAGSSSATVVLNVVDDTIPESSETVRITASAPRWTSGVLEATIEDDDEPTIALSFASQYISEIDGSYALIGTVARAEAVDSALRVALSCQNDPENERFIRLPREVVIPANETSVEFFVDAIDGWEITGDVELTIVASGIQENCGCSMTSASSGSATATVTFLDDDRAALRLNVDKTVLEAGETTFATISRAEATNEPLVVTLRSSDSSALSVPEQVVIPGGKTVSDPFELVANENVGSSWTTLLATANGMSSVSSMIHVTSFRNPDLFVSDIEFPSSQYAGATTSLSYVVGNRGTAPADVVGGWIEKVWLSKTRVPGDDAVLLATCSHTGALSHEPGQNSYTRIAEVELPKVVGSYWIVVEVDSERAVDDLIRVNNTVASATPLYIAAPYSVVVETDVEKAGVGDAVPLFGTAYRNDVFDENGEKTIPAANVDVAIHIVSLTTGIVRTINATTDENGQWTAQWTPYANEFGTFEVSATHPALESGTRQDSFSVMKLVVNGTSGFVGLYDGEYASKSFVLANPTNIPLTGLKCELLEKSDSIDVELNLAELIAGYGETTANVTLHALNMENPRSLVTLRFSADGVQPVDVSFEVFVAPLEPSVSCYADLNAAVVPGSQKTLKLELTNNGGAETGEISFAFPVQWISCLQGATLKSLAPGETRTIDVLFSPQDDVELTIWNGNFAINYANRSTRVPFSIRTVSECVGSLSLVAVDEWYYYDETKPTLAGAAVSVVDSLSGATVVSGVTDASGSFNVADLPEGYYDVRVSAGEHDEFTSTFYVKDGANSMLACLPYQAVTYEWTVTPTTIEDVYDIEVKTNFVTNVPKPVVIAKPEKIDLTPLTAVGDRMQVEIEFTNHGFIAASNVMLNFDGGGRYKMTPLVEIVDVLPAKTTVVVPCIIERIDETAADVHDVSNATESGGGWAGSNDCFNASCGYIYDWECGGVRRASAPIALVYAGGTGCGSSLYVPTSKYSGGGYYFGGSGSGNYSGYSGGWFPGGGSGYTGSGSISAAKVSVSSSNCNPCDCKPTKVEGSFSVGWISEFLADKLAKVLSKLWPTGDVSVDKLNLSVAGSREKCCQPCSSGSGQEDTGKWQWSLSASAGVAAGVFYGFKCETSLVDYLDYIDIPGLELYDAEASFKAGVELNLGGGISIEGGKDCDGNVTLCGSVSASGSVAPVLSGSISIGGKVFGDGEKEWSGLSAEITGTISTGVSATVGWCKGKGWSLEACWDGITVEGVFELQLPTYVQIPASEQPTNKLGGRISLPLVEKKCIGNSNSSAVVEAETDSSSTGDQEPSGRPVFTWEEFFGTDLDLADLDDFSELENWRPTAADLAEGMGYESYDEMKEELGLSFAADDVLTDDDVDAIYTAYDEAQSAADKGVCATVSMQIEQKAVLTRDAFDARLVLTNATTKDLDDVDVNIVVMDSNGNDVTSMFAVKAPTTEGFTGGDGESLGALSGKTQGVAHWILVPSTELAQDGPEEYYVGGYLSYSRNGATVVHKMAAASITVFPQPELELTYFMQHDVFADDPWTDEIEPSELFELAVMVKNNGAGVAQNLYIESAQPKIVDNEKGLLVDFCIVGSQVDGEEASPTLTVNFGNVEPGEITIGEWFMTSTLQGQFEDCEVSFRHRNDFGDEQFSIIKKVEILSLIRKVDAQNGDAKPDFLVNAIEDSKATPDTLYLSDGAVEAVSVATNAGFEGEHANDLSMTVSATLQHGWNYARLTDDRLQLGDYRLVRVVRDDGVEIPLENAWTTDRTLKGADKRPVIQDAFHLLDFNADDSEARHTYTLYFDSSDQTPPTILAIANPSEGVSYRTLPLESLEFEFSEPINASTLTADAVEMTRNGENVDLAGIAFENVSGTLYRIVNLPDSASSDGEYVLTINTLGIKDVNGNQGVDERFDVSWTTAAEAPIVVGFENAPEGNADAAIESVEVVFSQAISPRSFTTDDLLLTRGNADDNLIDSQKVSIVRINESRYRIMGLAYATGEEDKYFLTVKSRGVASAAGVAGVGEKTLVWQKDTIGPGSAVWDGDAAGYMNVPAYSVDVVFDEPVTFESFQLDDVAFTRNGEPITLDSNFVMGVVDTTEQGQRWRIVGLEHFLTDDGVYEITLNLAGLQDVYGNSGVGSSSYSWVYDTQAPTLTVDSTTIWANSETVVIAPTVSEENVSIAVYDAWTNQLLRRTKAEGGAFETTVQLPGDSVRELKIQATDAAGNVSETTLSVIMDTTAPTVEKVETRSVAAGDSSDELRVSFSEAVNIESLVQTGEIVDVVTLASAIGGGVFSLKATDFRFDAATRTLVVSLDDLDPALLKESISSIQDSIANAPIALAIDSTRVRDRAGNMLRGTDLSANDGAPDLLGAHKVVAKLDSYSAPALGDWNDDGKLDLIVGEKSADGKGRVKVFLNQGTDGARVYADGFYAGRQDENGDVVEIVVSAGGCQGAAPRLADITGDGLDDLIVGLSNGTIQLYRGVSTSPRVFAAPELLVVGDLGAKSTLDVGNRAVFDVFDWNDDGRNDLVVGAMDGKLRVYLDASQTAGEYDYRAATTLTDGVGELVVDSGRSAPAIADVNGDGLFDIATGATSGSVFVYLNVGATGAPKFQSAVPLVDAAGVALNVGDLARSRLVARDVNGDGVTDYFVGGADGSVQYYEGLRLVAPNSNGAPGDEFCGATIFAFDYEQLSNSIRFDYDASTRVADVSWNAIADAESYKVLISKNDGETWTVYKTGVTTTSIGANGLYAGKSYGFRVYGLDGAGATLERYYEKAFAPIALTSSISEYSAGSPITVSVVGAANASATIGWYYVTDAGDVEIASARNSHSFTPSQADCDIKVVATGTGDSRGSSASLVIAPAAQRRLDSPTITTTTAAADKIVVKWDAVENATGYVVEYKKSADSDASWTIMSTTTANSRTISTLDADTTYDVRIVAKGDATWADSEYSATVSVKTKPTTELQLDSPTITTTTATADKIVVKWDAVENATGYVVEYKKSADSDASWTVMSTTTANSRTIAELDADTTYDVRIVATGDATWADSDYSATVSVKTKPKELAPLDAPTWKSSSSTANSVTVVWNAVDNASGYVVEYKGPADTGFIPLPETSATTLTITELNAETTYKFRVYAVGDGATGANSACGAIKAVKTKAPEPNPLVVGQTAPYDTVNRNVATSWNLVEGATSYRFLKDVNGSWARAALITVENGVVTSGNATIADGRMTYTINMFNAGTEGKFSVVAINEQGWTLDAQEFSYASFGLELDHEAYRPEGDVITATTTPATDALYQWYVSNDAGTTWNAIDGANLASLTLSRDDAANLSWYRLVATEGARQSVAYAKPALVDAPSALSVHVDDQNLLVMNFVGVSDAQAYQVEYYLDDSEYPVWINLTRVSYASAVDPDGTVTVTATHANGASYAGYKLRVRSLTSDGWSVWRSSSTLDAPAITTTTASEDRIVVKWSAVENATGYVVEYKKATAPDSAWTVMSTTTATSRTISGLDANTTYDVRIVARGDATWADSEYSATVSVSTKPKALTPLDAPTWKSSSMTADSITVVWNAVDNASGYVVEYKGPTDTNFAPLPKTNATTLTITGLEPETTYKFRVLAVGDGDNYADSGYGAIKAVKTKAGPKRLTAPAITTTTATEDRIVVKWSAVENATGYVVEYKKATEPDSAWTVMSPTTATSRTISGLDANTTYDVRIVARGDATWADSEYSATVS
ncbi:MAG: fibronectin type III domain-containing protein, partial [Thermoguttaceae bacterium]|nr:fibronectin type III domain-containing protein [Thermoguttaceae bacterium]